MTAPAFIAQCERRGIRLAVVGEKLKASGSPPPNPKAFAAFLKSRKAEIIAELLGIEPPTPLNAGMPRAASVGLVERPNPSDGTDDPQNSPKTAPDRYQKSIGTVSDSGDLSDFSDGSTRGRARESDLPRETDPEFPAWLAYAKATAGRVASFEEWQADRVPVELAELGRVVEDLLAVPEEAAHADAWADALEWLETLEPIAWPRSHVFIPCVASWLRFAGERRNRFRRLYGPDWAVKSNIGAALAQDLTELRRFLLSIPEEVRMKTHQNASEPGALFD